MTAPGGLAGDGFDLEAYQRASLGLRSLDHDLPEDRLQALARDVLTRVAQGGAAHRAAIAALDDTDRDIDPDGDDDCGRRVAQFCGALLAEDPTAAARMIERAKRFGVSVEEIYLAYLTPGARQLGTLWRCNRASFAEVSIGISRIYGIMRGLRDSLPLNLSPDARRASFASIPGEAHSLGVSVAADLFRKDGWTIDLHVGLDHDALLDVLIDEHPPIIGLSAASPDHLPELVTLMTALHAAQVPSRIVIAGPIVAARPDVGVVTGADACAEDFETARIEVERLWNSLSGAARQATLN